MVQPGRWVGCLAFLVAAVLALGFWAWRGQPVAVVDSPTEKFRCVSYAPYRGEQTPYNPDRLIPPEQIDADLRILAARTACVRTYSVIQGLGHVPVAARAAGVKVLLGIWISRDPEANAKEIAKAVEVANANRDTIRAIVVGNEVMLRGELPAAQLVDLIREVKAKTGLPVTYADVWEFWEKFPQIAPAVDFVTIHILPYWEDHPIGIDRAVAHIFAIHDSVQQQFPGRTLLIGETGWPSFGRQREAARPSRVNQARFMREFLAQAETRQVDYNLIEAFDQPWKRQAEGAVGGNWGLYSEAREPKFSMRGAIIEDPSWRWHAGMAIPLAALLLVPAFLGRPRPTAWLGLALAAHVAATGLVLQFRQVVETARNAVEWATGGLGLALGALVAVSLIQLFASSRPWPAAAGTRRVLDWVERPSSVAFDAALRLGLLRLISTVAIAVVSLGLAFDARYRDFPVALYALTAGGFLLLHLTGEAEDAAEVQAEPWLASILAAGAVAVLAIEGVQNGFALAWTAIVFAAALPYARSSLSSASKSPTAASSVL
jgi:exo-beta-1,3-glucanase (GH17 family)